jgi:CRP-like cAMP-binding protein
MKHPNTQLASNKLLAVLSSTPSIARLLPHLSPVRLRRDEVLHEHGQPAANVYFPTNSMVSLSCMATDGSMSELTAVGREGMIGISAIMGAAAAGSWATVVRAGNAWRLPGKILQQEFAQEEACQRLLLRYLHTLLMDISHHSLCDSRHCLQQRLCRLLLEMRDRGASDEFPATQELIAHRLGVRRESVSAAARILQRDGLIRYWRGRIHVLDSETLAAQSCDCYEPIRAEYEHLYASEVRQATRWDRTVSLRHQSNGSLNQWVNPA